LNMRNSKPNRSKRQ